MPRRRQVLQGIGGTLALAALPRLARSAETPVTPGVPDGVSANAVLDALPGKRPLIKLSYRPPNYETPLGYFATPITPNDAFFVRYHLSGIPQEVDAAGWKIRVGGDGAATPYELTMADLTRGLEQVEVTAVCQCSGNRRGLSTPHVAGVEWGIGAMGNAVWRGVRLKDVLAKAGLRKETVEIVLDGADKAPLATTPDFVKSIPSWKALDENTILAHSMNGQPLPLLNGAPVRLIVPGWTGTYWMKHLVSIDAVTKPFDGFWMKSAYRIPAGKFPVVSRFGTQETEANEPITEMVVNSLITSPTEGGKVRAGDALTVRGIAWDGGYGIARVEISLDQGKSWRPATLGQDLGRFGFRPWSHRLTPHAGKTVILAKATNKLGQTQVDSLIFNPAGYHNNVISRVTIAAA